MKRKLKVENQDRIWISASLSCADMLNLGSVIKELNYSTIDFLHYDVVDGKFNDCFVFGDLVLKTIRPIFSKPIEVHLAVENVYPYIEPFAKAGADYIAIHYEIKDDIQEIFQLIKKAGARPILAFRSDTEVPPNFIDLAKQVDWILKLTVHPGYAGQRMQKQTIQHIQEMKRLILKHNLSTRIQADGNICEETIRIISRAGADILTGGTSGLFGKKDSIQEAINKIKEEVE